MPIGLLKTKLYRPAVRDSWVARLRLRAQLDRGVRAGERLILISAPAGYGKSTLLAEWVASRQLASAWLSLDKQDDDPVRFWMYVIAALQTINPDLGAGTFELLQSPQPPPILLLLPDLLNEIGNLSDPTILILDDYHVISAPAIHESIAFVLEHLPPSWHLALSTRADPPLPLARLRARNQVVELRAQELRFTTDEALTFLNRSMELNLPLREVESLNARTEGWAVGLQLAALSLQGQSNPRQYIEAFTGEHHYVLEYLVDEVISRQPERVQRFMTQTCILERLYGSLCDAVMGDPSDGDGENDGAALLANLYRGNLFVVPLDDEHAWYRYHHLFADLLRARLQQSDPGLIETLHRRAAKWYDENRFGTEAVQHALAARDYAGAADLVERYVAERWSLSDTVFLTAIGKLPPELLQSRPGLGIHHAFMLVLQGQHQLAEGFLRAMLRHIPSHPDAEMKGIASFATVLLVYIGELTGQETADALPDPQSLQYVPEHLLAMRNTAEVTYSFLLYFRGEFDRAEELIRGAVQRDIAARGSNVIPVAISRLARIRVIQGRLHEAAALCREYLKRIEERGSRQFYIAGSLNVVLGDVLREWNDLERAEQEIRAGVRLNEAWPNPEHAAFGSYNLARVLLAKGDVAGSREALDQAEATIQGRTISPDLLSDIRALRVRLWHAAGEMDSVRGWVAAFLSGDRLDLSRERDHISYARALIALGRAAEAEPLLARLAQGVAAGKRVGRQIEIALLQAIAANALQHMSLALQILKACLALAEPEGYRRVFLDEGEPAKVLLAAFRSQKGTHSTRLSEYVDPILSDLPRAAVPHAPTQDLVEPLTPRELSVLQLIAAGDSNQTIADKLVITLSAVKKHTGHILGKLGVSSRTQAIARARQLGLLPTDM